MTLTFSHGPLASDPPETVNYRIEGPEHRLLMDAFPRRLRAELGGENVLDTTAAELLQETGHLPQLYVPEGDVRFDLLEQTDHETRCPFKGDAIYWSVRAGSKLAENAVWGYPDPIEGADWLRGYVACYWNSMDRWLDEDEEVFGHTCDPYHRVDLRSSSRHVRVLADGEQLAETRRPLLLSETGLQNRWYIPPDDVRLDLLVESDRHSVCPYKGVASYWSAQLGERRIEDIAWGYPEPLGEALKVRGYLCFLGEAIVVEVDGQPSE